MGRLLALWSLIVLIVKNYSRNEREEILHSEAISKTWKHKGSAVPDSLQHTVNFGMKSPTDIESANNLKYGNHILLFYFFLVPQCRCILLFFSPEAKQVLL